MKIMDKEMQMFAVEKVLEEMEKVEEFVSKWNASWWEQCLDAYSEELNSIGIYDIQGLEKKYQEQYKLSNVYEQKSRIGVPLRKTTLVDDYGKEYQVEFGRIDWNAMSSHKSTRQFSFYNDGNIQFSKDVTKQLTKQQLRHISYNAMYNVLSNDFSLDIRIKERNGERKNIVYHYITISLNDNILTKKMDDIEIMQDLNSGMKFIRIIKKYDKNDKQSNSSVVFEVKLNEEDRLELGAVAINTYKRNGKVNGTYRFDVSRKKGARANFYSRKGVKIDLIENPILLENANTLLLPAPTNQNCGEIIVSDFVSSTQKSVAKNLEQKVICFDNSDFNMDSIKQAETKIIETVKCIKGEIPLLGLVERINNCLEFSNRRPNLQTLNGFKSRVLKLESTMKN